MSFDFSQYRAPEEEEEVSEEVKVQTPQGSFDFSQFSVQEEPSLGQEVGRHAARTASRVGETITGMPGDVIQLSKWISEKLPNIPDSIKQEPNFVQKIGKRVLENVPTSGDIKEKMSEITSGFVDPQSATEEFGDSIVELASALIVGKDPTKIKNLLGALGKASGAKAVKKGSEALGAGPKGQFAAEMGTLLLMGMAKQPMARKYVSDQYKKAAQLIPEKTMIPTASLEGELKSLQEELGKGISTPSKSEVSKSINELQGKISGGAYPAEELVEVFHNINEKADAKGLFNDLSKSQKQKLRFRYNKFKNAVTSEIETYGKKNPKFLKEWKEANQAHKTIKDSQKVSSFLESKVGKLPSHLVTGMAVEVIMGQPEAAAATAGAFGALKTGELLYRVASSPSLQKHYLNVITAAQAENLPALISSLDKLEKGLQRSFKEKE